MAKSQSCKDQSLGLVVTGILGTCTCECSDGLYTYSIPDVYKSSCLIDSFSTNIKRKDDVK